MRLPNCLPKRLLHFRFLDPKYDSAYFTCSHWQQALPTFSTFAGLLGKNYYHVLIFIYLCMRLSYLFTYLLFNVFLSLWTTFSCPLYFTVLSAPQTLPAFSWFPMESGRCNDDKISNDCRLTWLLSPNLQKKWIWVFCSHYFGNLLLKNSLLKSIKIFLYLIALCGYTQILFSWISIVIEIYFKE